MNPIEERLSKVEKQLAELRERYETHWHHGTAEFSPTLGPNNSRDFVTKLRQQPPSVQKEVEAAIEKWLEEHKKK